MRDNSKGLVYSNKIYSNFYQISTRSYKKVETNKLLSENDIEGENEFSVDCSIFWTNVGLEASNGVMSL